MKVKHVFLIPLLVTLGTVTTWVSGAEITGPSTITVGELATFASDIEGDCVIVPTDGIGMAKDSNKKQFYVTGTTPGTYTLVFVCIEDGIATMKQAKLEIESGITPEPEPKPTPTPEPPPTPEPEPIPLPTLTGEEINALNYAINTVIENIDNGIVRTPQGARSSFKHAIANSLVTISKDMEETLNALNEQTDYTNVKTIKNSWKKFQETLK